VSESLLAARMAPAFGYPVVMLWTGPQGLERPWPTAPSTGASAAVSAVIAKAKLAGMWREKPEQTNSGPVIVEVNWPNVN